MNEEEKHVLAVHELSDDEFSRLSAFVYEQIGISLPAVKKTMLQARMQKRLRLLGMKSFRDYIAFLFSAEGVKHEMGEFINAVTTNKTDFFREPYHFEYLVSAALPILEHRGATRARIWSAACSSGQECYTLAMFCAEYALAHPRFTWSVLGTDISTRVLDKAVTAVYTDEDAEPIPMPMRRKYLLRSKDPAKGLVKICPELRQSVKFRQLNLMEKEYPIDQQFDIIFCRNVIIYFDKPTQATLLAHLVEYLAPGGFLFLGHSETLSGFSLPLEAVASTIYRKKG